MKKYLVLLFLIILAGFTIFSLSGSRTHMLFPLPNFFKTSQPLVVISSGTFVQGDSFYTILEKQNIPPFKITSAVKNLSKHISPRSVREGHSYSISKTTNNVLLSFSYFPSPIEEYLVRQSTTGIYTVSYEKESLKKSFTGFKGIITSSLYEAVVNKGGGSANLAMNFADIFAWQIDFLTEPQKGDTFLFVYEKLSSKRGYIKTGNIVAAQYKTKNKTYKAFLFDYGKGLHYYDENGKSMRRMFLRSPLNYRRISSYFSRKRFHPILKYYRPHLGIDYAAPRGTPIVSIGDGKVTFAGRRGGYGKIIKIRHNQKYETWYGHLHRYGKGIKRGRRIKQGQVIGYVGSTGLATGPHLDFRIKQWGKFVNFLRLTLPPANSVLKKHMKKFKQTKQKLYLKLAKTQQKTDYRQ